MRLPWLMARGCCVQLWSFGEEDAGGVFGFGSCGGVVPYRMGVLRGTFLGVFERCCVSACFGIRLVLGLFRGLCTVVFLATTNVVGVV